MSVVVPTLETDRLIMRPPSADAFPHYEEFYTDADASRFYEGPMTVGKTWATLAADIGYWQLQGFGVWVLEQKSDGRLLGGLWVLARQGMATRTHLVAAARSPRQRQCVRSFPRCDCPRL